MLRIRSAPVVALLLLLSPMAYGGPPFGNLRGVTRNAEGAPLPAVQVVVHSMDENLDRTVVSGDDGAFTVENLPPGRYQLTASKEGLARSPAITIELAAQESLRADLTLASLNDLKGGSGPPTAATPVISATQAPAQGGFLKRLIKAYADDWKGTTTSGPDPPRRGYPAPVDGPPFPFSDWPYGGSPVIGASWTQSSPLMQAIWSGPNGDAWKKSAIQIYGWLNGGFNVSSSDKPGYSTLPAAYTERPNSFQPNQEVLYIEREPDTVQTDHFDWGFRIANLYGIDYRFTTAKGIFSQQLLKENKEYGYDPVMFYADLYFPNVAQGMNVRIGRYISLPDIEAQLAPNNYTYSHSLTYTYDCYTQTGINATIKLNVHWKIQVGLSSGCEAAFWTRPDSKPTVNFCAIYEWNNGYDNMYPCLNALNDGKYAYNNLNAIYNTWYHRFRRFPSIHTDTEWWYMWERDVPNVNNPAAASLLQTNANGAVCDNAAELTCYAPEWSIVNYVEKQYGKHDYLTIRNEYFDDMRGQRTGFRSHYTEHLIGWGHWVGTTVLFRPEIRFERSYDVAAYDNGTKKNQLMLAGDILYFF